MTNEELFEITSSASLSSLLKFYRLRWAGYLNTSIEALKMKGLKVNILKIKVMMSDRNLDLKKCGNYAYDVCFSGVNLILFFAVVGFIKNVVVRKVY